MMMLLLIRVVASVVANSTVVLYSAETSQSLLNQLSGAPKYMLAGQDWSQVVSDLAQFDFLFLMDVTLSPDFFITLDSVAAFFSTVYLTLTADSTGFYSPLRYVLHATPAQEVAAIASFVEYLGWDRAVLMATNKYQDLEVADSVYTMLQKSVLSFIKYEESIVNDTAGRIVARMIKAKGIRQALLIDSGASATVFATALELKKMNTLGTSIVFSSRGCLSTYIEGSILLVESGLETATTCESYHVLSIAKAVEAISQLLSNTQFITPSTLADSLDRFFPSHSFFTQFSVLNIQNSRPVSVGSFSSSLHVFSPIYFPGNTTTPSLYSSSLLLLSIANGTNEINTNYTLGLFAEWYQGARYAVEQSNLKNEFPGFKIELNPTNCGLYNFDPVLTPACLLRAMPLGIVYLAPIWFSAALGTLWSLQALDSFLNLHPPADNILPTPTYF
jgi:hypothetical protein